MLSYVKTFANKRNSSLIHSNKGTPFLYLIGKPLPFHIKKSELFPQTFSTNYGFEFSFSFHSCDQASILFELPGSISSIVAAAHCKASL